MLFQKAQKAHPQRMTGAEGRDYFMKSGLSTQELAKIWGLSDRQTRGWLDEDEFCIAMAFTYARRNGQNIPDAVPQSLIQSIYSTPSPAPSAYSSSSYSSATSSAYNSSGNPPPGPGALVLVSDTKQDEWSLTQADKEKYTNFFNQLDTTKSGKISGQVAAPLFTQSGLNKNDLANIWNLSDLSRDGLLDRNEFFIAFHLITCHVQKKLPIPTQLPQTLIDSIRNDNQMGGYGQNPGGYGSGGNPQVAPQIFGSAILEQELLEKKRKEEQERQRTAALKEQIYVKLTQKADIIKKIILFQQQTIDRAQKLSIQEQQVERIKKVTKELEVTSERQKLRIAAFNEKIQLVKTQAASIREQKRGLDSIIMQRQSQFQEEQSRVTAIGQKLTEDRQAFDRQREELYRLKQEVATVKNQKLQAEQRKAQIDLLRRQEAEEAERRRQEEERRRQEEERRRQEEEQRRRLLEAQAQEEERKRQEEDRRKFAEAEARRLKLEQERLEIERQKEELMKKRKELENAMPNQLPPAAVSVQSSTDTSGYYDKFIDDFGNRTGAPPKKEALYFNAQHPEFPPGFYPDTQDFSTLIFNSFPKTTVAAPAASALPQPLPAASLPGQLPPPSHLPASSQLPTPGQLPSQLPPSSLPKPLQSSSEEDSSSEDEVPIHHNPYVQQQQQTAQPMFDAGYWTGEANKAGSALPASTSSESPFFADSNFANSRGEPSVSHSRGNDDLFLGGSMGGPSSQSKPQEETNPFGNWQEMASTTSPSSANDILGNLFTQTPDVSNVIKFDKLFDD
jgi:epidermal growth factor receptor substrate 15